MKFKNYIKVVAITMVACALLQAEVVVHANEQQPHAKNDAAAITYQGLNIFQAANQGKLAILTHLVEVDHVDVNASNKDGYKPIACAAYFFEASKLPIIKYLVEHGADVNANNSFALLDPLKWFRGKLELVKYLIEHGADINAMTENHETALYLTTQRWLDFDITQYLVEHGAQINIATKQNKTALSNALRYYAYNPNTALYLLQHDAQATDEDLLLATQYKNIELMQLLNKNGAKNFNATNQYNQTPLTISLDDFSATYMTNNETKHIICPSSVAFTKFLIDQGANVNQANQEGATPLIKATQKNTIPFLQLLLDHGAHINTQDLQGNTALIEAVKRKSLMLVQFLINHSADTTIINKEGKTALQIAHELNLAQIENYIQTVHNNTHQAPPNILEKTPYETTYQGLDIFQAVQHNNMQAVQYLVETNHVNVNIQNEDGNCPIQMMNNNNWKIIQYLIEHGANINHRNTYGFSIIYFCLYDTTRLQYLIEHGAEYNISLINLAIITSQFEAAKTLILNMQNINHQDSDGNSLIILALRLKDPDFIKAIIQKGANVNLRNNNGQTVLMQTIPFTKKIIHLSVKNNEKIPHDISEYTYTNLPIAEILLEHHAQTNIQDINGDTALILATKRCPGLEKFLQKNPATTLQDLQEQLQKILTTNPSPTATDWQKAGNQLVDLRFIQLLLDHHANPTIRNKDGKTALDIAKEQNNRILVELFEQAKTQ